MKTPREILLARHKAVEPKLDDVRQSAVAAVYDRRSSPSPTVVAILKTLWHELVLPSRRIWTGLATVWILIVIANVAMRDHAPVTMAKSPSPEMVHTFSTTGTIADRIDWPARRVRRRTAKALHPAPIQPAVS